MVSPTLTKTRPIGKIDAQGRPIPNSFEDLAFQADYTTPTSVYFGYARAGSSTSASVWQISLHTFNGSGELTAVTWPENTLGEASTEYIFDWASRASYTYI